ncbi:hypothetical protein MAHJHV57_49710 [Mycobacterium avium subsp. hominissuis]
MAGGPAPQRRPRVAGRATAEIVERAALLDIPAAALGEARPAAEHIQPTAPGGAGFPP